MDDIVLAKNIADCAHCPLHGNDCSGGWTSSGSGTPIEPPCTSWSEDTEVYEGMYDDDPRDFGDSDDFATNSAAPQKNDREQTKLVEIQKLKDKVHSITGGEYRHVELRERGSVCNDWLCPYCKTWRRVSSESWHSGIGEAWCSKCQRSIVYCAELEVLI